jgi:signal peptidase I
MNSKNKFFRLLILLIIFGVIINIGYRKFKVEGESMDATYKDGDTLLVDKTTHKINKPERGDVVVFYDIEEDDYLLKRIIGLPGELVEIVDGDIYINGILHEDEFSHLKIRVMLVGSAGIPLRGFESGKIIYENEDKKFPRLKENEYWVIGDSREESWYGTIYKDTITGTAK